MQQLIGCLLFVACVAAEERPLVHSHLGSMQGAWQTSANGKRYAAFTGIPFAQPPLGNLRFEPPKQISAWTGLYDAGRPIKECVNFLLPSSEGEEDCLYLNVFTHNLKKTKLMPVIVYIHSGAFMFGGATFYGGKYAMDRDVVFVVINYRLGPLGFLSLEDDVQPGNNGMRDQVAALKWVQDHVSAFGGDPDQVTLMGCSAGGASVHYHYLSPLSRGLFKRGVSMSGTALSRWALADGAREKALRLAASVGCSSNVSSQAIVDCLKKTSVEQLFNNSKQFEYSTHSPFSPFAPVVEKGSQTIAPFLPDQPLRMLNKGEMLRLPWVTGVTTHEGLYPIGFYIGNDEMLQFVDQNFTQFVPHLLHFNFTVKAGTQGEVASRIRKEYLGDEVVDANTVQKIIKMASDRLFFVDAQRAAEIQAKFAPVYFYEFGYRGENSLSDLLSETKINFGTSHTDDQIYFTNISFYPEETRTGMAKRVENLMLDLWSSFATNGFPKAVEAPEWKPVEVGKDLKLLRIESVPPVMTQVKDLGNAKFWQSLPIIEKSQSDANIKIPELPLYAFAKYIFDFVF